MNTLDELTKAGVNVYIQNLPLCTLNEDGQPDPIAKMITAVISSFAEIERDNIKYRLNSGRELAKAKGVKKGKSIRDTAKLCDVNISTVQRVKRVFVL